MFQDARSRRVVFVAHCILNQNVISDGTADLPGSDAALVRRLLEAGVSPSVVVPQDHARIDP